MASEIDTSREVRGWIKIFQNDENKRKLEMFTITLNGLRQAFSNLNQEMKMFNENATKSNKFLGRIAHLQESMEAQAKATTWLNWTVVGFAALQVILVAIQIWLKP